MSARRRSAEKRREPEGVLTALFNLVAKNRRRYGGYIVHLGIVGMFVGFVGSAWNLEREVTLVPGQTHQIGNFDIKYLGTRMCPGNPKCSAEEQSDLNKRMLFADFNVVENGKRLGQIHPAKFFYAKNPDGPTTEVSLLQSMKQDLYTVIGTIDPQSKRGTFRFPREPARHVDLDGRIHPGVRRRYLALARLCSRRARRMGIRARRSWCRGRRSVLRCGSPCRPATPTPRFARNPAHRRP